MSKIKEVLEKIGKDVLTEETKTALAEAFNTTVNEIVAERIKLETDTAVSKLDEEHTAKLEQLLEAIDKDHSEKLKKVLQKIDEDHGEKLQTVVKKYEKMLQEEAIDFRNSVVEEVSNYLDLYLDKTVPTKQISEAVESMQARRMIEEIKKVVSVDESYITSNIKEALEDGKSMIDGLRNELNEAIKENVKLNQEVKNVKAGLVIEQKTSNLPKQKKDFIVRVLKDKSPEYIAENFDYTLEMFEREEKEATQVIAEQARKETASATVDTPTKVLEESVETSQNTGKPVNGYLKELTRLDRR